MNAGAAQSPVQRAPSTSRRDGGAQGGRATGSQPMGRTEVVGREPLVPGTVSHPV